MTVAALLYLTIDGTKGKHPTTSAPNQPKLAQLGFFIKSYPLCPNETKSPISPPPISVVVRAF